MAESPFPLGPQPGVSYPLEILYCGDDQPECEAGEESKKRQKRGGKGAPKAPKQKGTANIEQKITVQRAPRGKKSTTVVKGLGTYEIDLKQAAKFFASKFACGSSVTGTDEIVIQGDVKDDLIDIIPEKWKQVLQLIQGR